MAQQLVANIVLCFTASIGAFDTKDLLYLFCSMAVYRRHERPPSQQPFQWRIYQCLSAGEIRKYRLSDFPMTPLLCRSNMFCPKTLYGTDGMLLCALWSDMRIMSFSDWLAMVNILQGVFNFLFDHVFIFVGRV